MNRHLRSPRRSDRAEFGYAVVMTSLVLVPLIGFAGFAVDVGNWYTSANRIHRAADAASLAGVVWLPDVATATSVALDVAAQNGYDNADPTVTVTVTQRGPAELEVEITESDLDLYFVGMFVDSVDISRSATSEYIKSIAMGNPENYLGTDPERGISEQNYLSISGAGTEKVGGDRFAGKDCNPGGTGAVALCANNTNGNLPSNGGEFKQENYHFTVRVNAVQPAPLVFEIYDPGFYEGSQQCNNHGNFPNGYDFNDLLNGDLDLLFPGEVPADWQQRYANSPGAIYCSGDTPSSGDGSITSVYVRAPDTTPFNPLDNPIISQADCTPQQYGVYDEDFYDLLEQVTVPPSHPYANDFALEFRRWVQYCKINAPVVGDYIVQVRSDASAGNPTVYDPTYNEGGRNHYSLRAGWDFGGAFPDGAGVELFANGHMAIDVNVPAATTTMELARITEEYAGRRLAIELWDVGDASNPGTLEILEPVDLISPTLFANCDITNTKAGWWDPDPTDCAAPVTYANMNGNLLTINVDVPTDWDCDELSPTGCYIRVRVDFPVGTTVYDHTTWSVRVVGDPIRLIE